MKITLIILLCLCLALPACQGYSVGATSSSQSNNGVNIEFLSENVYTFDSEDATQKETIEVEVRNVGESKIFSGNIPGLQISLIGIDPLEYNIGTKDSLTQTNIESLEATERVDGTYFEGGTEHFTWDFRYVPQSEITFNIGAEVCYSYETRNVVFFCQLGDAEEEDSICQVEGRKKFVSGRAPIKITDVVQKDKRLEITVENKGTGEVYLPPSIPSFCEKENKNKIYVLVDYGTGNDERFCGNERCITRCSGLTNSDPGVFATLRGELAFRQSQEKQEKTIVCNINSDGEVNADRPIRVVLDYQYSQTQQTPITIEKD